jgi:hypothetical protein
MTGTREFRDANKVGEALKHIVANCPDNEPLFVIHYATNMVDGYVDAFCKAAGIKVQEIAPEWRTDGKAALYRLAEKTIPGSDQVILFGSDAVVEHSITVANANGVKVSKVVPTQVLEALPI